MIGECRGQKHNHCDICMQSSRRIHGALYSYEQYIALTDLIYQCHTPRFGITKDLSSMLLNGALARLC
jgi:hypothetical protein